MNCCLARTVLDRELDDIKQQRYGSERMKNAIIGTAGHAITARRLIKALLVSIQIDYPKRRWNHHRSPGFAHIDNDAGYNIGVIDVPGHEKFIKNMPLESVVLTCERKFVVAADEGIMPQTKEHLKYCKRLESMMQII